MQLDLQLETIQQQLSRIRAERRQLAEQEANLLLRQSHDEYLKNNAARFDAGGLRPQTRYNRAKIIEYLSSYKDVLTGKQLHRLMRKQGMTPKYTTVRSYLHRLCAEKYITQDFSSRKFTALYKTHESLMEAHRR